VVVTGIRVDRPTAAVAEPSDDEDRWIRAYAWLPCSLEQLAHLGRARVVIAEVGIGWDGSVDGDGPLHRGVDGAVIGECAGRGERLAERGAGCEGVALE